VYGTGAALGDPAGVFRAGKMKCFPQGPEQTGAFIGFYFNRFSVEFKRAGHKLLDWV
jgi:hypothetical protein